MEEDIGTVDRFRRRVRSHTLRPSAHPRSTCEVSASCERIARWSPRDTLPPARRSTARMRSPISRPRSGCAALGDRDGSTGSSDCLPMPDAQDPRKDDDRQDEIRHRPCQRPSASVSKGPHHGSWQRFPRALSVSSVFPGGGRVVVAEELHIAPERQHRDPPAGAAPVGPADDFLARNRWKRSPPGSRTSARRCSGRIHERKRRSTARSGRRRSVCRTRLR